jgi:hypothetical protein
MGSKPLNRRALIKSGAAFAGGLTLGAAAPAMGAQQTPDSHHAPPSWPMIKGDKDMIAYGDRSKYVTSVRIAHPVGGRPSPDLWARGRILPLRAPFATTVWDYINRGMPLNREGTLTPDEVYSLTAFLLFINDVIPEDQALDQQSLPKVKMPIGDNYAALPNWKPRTKRLPGYPY